MTLPAHEDDMGARHQLEPSLVFREARERAGTVGWLALLGVSVLICGIAAAVAK